MLLSELMLALMYWTPLAALAVVSLELIVLKRVSRRPLWTARLVRPPFYFVALPVAALIFWDADARLRSQLFRGGRQGS